MVVLVKSQQEKILQKLKKEKLPPIISKFKHFFRVKPTKSYTFSKFCKRLLGFFEEGQHEILKIFVELGATVDMDPLDRPLKLVVSELNGAMPQNCPFAIAICQCRSIPGEYFFGVITRNQIPGIHEIIRRDIVPVCTCDSPKTIKKQKITLWRSPEVEDWFDNG